MMVVKVPNSAVVSAKEYPPKRSMPTKRKNGMVRK
jgi:hypothetical protein